MFSWLPITKRDDYEGLTALLSVFDFGLGDVVAWMRDNLSDVVGAVLVEHPYIDKDYRSTYYNYYAKKGSAYSPHSARLHMFRKGWELNETPLTLSQPAEGTNPDDDAVCSGYLGFVSLRPTRIQTIGRSVLSPEAVRQVKGRLIEHRHKAHVLGYRVLVKGFPFMQQHSDIAVCAHTACWAMLRHYSERYSLYREVLVHDISRLGREFDPGGLLPSLGITARDAERIFAAMGTYPLLVHGQDSADDGRARFYDEMLAYLDSGFPLFGIQSQRGHAVAIVGYRLGGKRQIDDAEYRQRAWDYVSHLLVVDDNHYPYMAIPRVQGSEPYAISDIDGFIVPLPEKMFLPAAAAFRFATALPEAPPDGFDDLADCPDLVMRCFVTTTASWQRYVRRHAGDLPADFASAALELTMAQFIWVVEYATPQQRSKHEVQARLLLDATAGTNDPFPAFLLHDRQGALWIDRANRIPMHYQKFDAPVSALAEMSDNLSEY